jgi:hypothetical protein
MISGFSFKILFLDDDGNCLDTTHTDIQVTATEDQEEDRDKAYSQADEWATEQLADCAADDFEISLVSAY